MARGKGGGGGGGGGGGLMHEWGRICGTLYGITIKRQLSFLR